jgi:hypothetical protein
MSRRAKLIITAGFLVPLLFLATYVALTWAPREPLRFHAVVVEGYGDVPPGWRVLEYVVENTSYAPIHLVEFDQAPGDNTLQPGLYGTVRLHSLEIAVQMVQSSCIPARGKVRTRRLIHEHDLQQYRGASLVQYIWISETRERFYSCYYWLYLHGPEWLRPHLPRLTLHYDSTPITVPPGA